MRRFEWISLFAAVFAVGWPVVFGVRPRRGLVAVVLVAVLFVQLQFEGFRWQMIPIYAGLVALAIGDVFFLDRTMNWTRRLGRGLLGAVGLALAVLLPVAFPVPEIPTPAGMNEIGTVTVHLVDRDREELYGPRPGRAPRELMVQVWYPVESAEDVDPGPWSADADIIAAALSREMGLPSWFWNHTEFTRGHTAEGLPIVDSTFPVLIYSHSWGGFRSDILNQIENLVSDGYIVIAPDHTFGALVTVFDDGEVVYQDPEAIPDPESVSETLFAEGVTALVDTYAADIGSVVDALENGATGPFGAVVDAADLNRLGIFGHGAGGGAAIKFCLVDERCDAVLGMDPWVTPLTERDLQENMIRPALYMRSEDWTATVDDALLRGIAGRGESITYSVSIEGALHSDFLMTPLLSPMAAQFGLKGPIPAGRVIPIISNYLVGFFDVFLLGTGSAALDSVSFEEATVTVVQR